MTSDFGRSFTHILIGDVNDSHQRVATADTPASRRDLVRSVFAAIEGLLWQLKSDVQEHSQIAARLSPHEFAAIMEETYAVSEDGTVRTQPRFLPLITSIRLTIKIVQRYRTTYQVDFNHTGWARLKTSILIRNRLVHPKTIDDLIINDDEIRDCLSAFNWFLALVIEILRITVDDKKNRLLALPQS